VLNFWGTPPYSRGVRLAVSAALVALLVGGLATFPAAQAAAPAPPAAQPQSGTWVGGLERAGNHYDYVGRACPESVQICYDIVARYRIVPLTPGAARSVRRLAGGQARLTGHLGPAQDSKHTGTLFVRKAERPAPAPKTVAVDETNNGQTVILQPGDHLQVVLHSTYWRFSPSSDPTVISADGQPVYQSPGPKGCGGPPGSGCGTVTARYTAHHAGAAEVSAGRTSCGEAMRCTPAQSRWSVKVNVAG
jgi:hypothetical protein